MKKPSRCLRCLLVLSAFALSASARADPPSLLDRAVVVTATQLAVTRAGLDPGATRSVASRARSAAWLPQLSVRVARNTGASTTQYVASSSDRQLLDDSLYVDVRVSLSLDRLVFDPHEVSLARVDLSRIERRLHLENTVLEALARAEQLRLSRAALPAEAQPEATWTFEFARARARVEMLTGASIESLLLRPPP